MLTNLLRVIFFIPFALCMFAFAGLGRLMVRIQGWEFFGRSILLGVLGVFSVVGVFLLGFIGKIYE